MFTQALVYEAGSTPLHLCDARIKIAVLFAYSIALCFISSWQALALFVAVFLAALFLAKLSFTRMCTALIPVIILAVCAIVFSVIASPTLEGFLSGAFVAIRMIVLVAASLVVCFTTSASELVKAFAWFISPLQKLHVPVNDIALTLTLALRFIPVIVEEFLQVRRAQIARGAALEGLSFKRKLKVWGAAFSAVFVGLFRHAATLAHALDARCYGARNKSS